MSVRNINTYYLCVWALHESRCLPPSSSTHYTPLPPAWYFVLKKMINSSIVSTQCQSGTSIRMTGAVCFGSCLCRDVRLSVISSSLIASVMKLSGNL
jgi:hypothetical protein